MTLQVSLGFQRTSSTVCARIMALGLGESQIEPDTPSARNVFYHTES